MYTLLFWSKWTICYFYAFSQIFIAENWKKTNNKCTAPKRHSKNCLSGMCLLSDYKSKCMITIRIIIIMISVIQNRRRRGISYKDGNILFIVFQSNWIVTNTILIFSISVNFLPTIHQYHFFVLTSYNWKNSLIWLLLLIQITINNKLLLTNRLFGDLYFFFGLT